VKESQRSLLTGLTLVFVSDGILLYYITFPWIQSIESARRTCVVYARDVRPEVEEKLGTVRFAFDGQQASTERNAHFQSIED
jgi:hypothetical protein